MRCCCCTWPLAPSPQPLALAKGLFRQLAHGVAALHAAGVAHLDISTANILLDDGDVAPGVPAVVLHDFGMAQAVGPGQKLLFTKRDCLVGKVRHGRERGPLCVCVRVLIGTSLLSLSLALSLSLSLSYLFRSAGEVPAAGVRAWPRNSRLRPARAPVLLLLLVLGP